MADLNVMLQEHARSGLQTQHDNAVTNGDIEGARKIVAEMEKLAVSIAPKAQPYTPDDVQAELAKLEWFGVDPKKSARTVELGKSMSLKKFNTAAEFAAALVKAVDEEFKKPEPAAADEDKEIEEGEETPAAVPKPRASDGPSDGDTANSRTPRRTSGPWTKMSDAPPDVQKEIKRTADKMVSSSAPKEQRDKFIAKALEAHYNKAAKGKNRT